MAGDVVPSKEQPLSGVILCCTSIPPELRGQIVATATEMGAVHRFDLTSEVTHLIVGQTNTPKYKYVAKARNDVKVLRVEWVEAVRSSWLQGGDTDLHALEVEYRFPTLGGLAICLTGFEDMNFRNQMREIVTANGGEFRHDLTKTVTHLIARVPEGQKYAFARKCDITVVGLKWFEDSLERGMILDESLYEPSVPIDEQGVGAWNRAAPSNFEKRAKPAASGRHRPRKLRRVASTKLGGQTDGIWTDIVGNETPASASEQTTNGFGSGKTGNTEVAADVRPVVQEVKSFASDTTLFDRPRSTTQDTVPVPFEAIQERPRGMWYRSKFYIHGFTTSQAKILKSHIHSHDGQIATSLEQLLDACNNDGSASLYILVPYNLPRTQFPSIDEDFEPEPEIVTDMWIEKCLYSNSFIPPESQITSTPVPKFPIPEFQGERISSTGFSGIDLLHLSKLVKLISAQYDEYLTSNTTVLVCHNMQPNSEKLRHVNEWKIPAVIADWLWISVQTGEKKPFERYIIPYRRPPTDVDGKNDVNGRENDALAKKPDASIKPSKDPPPQRQSRKVSQERPKQPEDDRNISPGKGTATQPHDDEQDLASADISRNPSRSVSPTKRYRKSSAPTVPLPQRPSRSDSTEPAKSAPLETAISDLLKQKRNGPQRSSSTDNNKEGGKRPRGRRQLLGRASSNSSTLATNNNNNPAQLHRGASRASSIDTMNEDGYGSVVEGMDSPSAKGNSNAQSFASGAGPTAKNADQLEALQSREDRLDFLRKYNILNDVGERDHAGLADEEQDADKPEMTQLGYEDPDAAAMREQIMQHAEKLNNESGDGGGSTKATAGNEKKQKQRKNADPGGNLVIGRLQDHELVAGWRGGRRTRSKKDAQGK